eukprot:GHVN01054426.1.p1 GENE.GHVN01054426.1~~GHVN01054426.1.p1  ORF type:complete len:129 (-),score=0.74 GHVN01054426.1:110-496(-)
MDGMCGLEDVIRHHANRISNILTESMCGDEEALLIGHSIGGLILLRAESLLDSTISAKIRGCGLLAPTITRWLNGRLCHPFLGSSCFQVQGAYPNNVAVSHLVALIGFSGNPTPWIKSVDAATQRGGE